ncbi:MAG: hypothetical protein HY703_09625, partial [Gemmatimonadetes bacterium]|nr:hypothetical protein [Gemmatimonadota bacterium]
AAFGQAKVEWDAFRRLTFETPPAALAAPRVDGGSRLRGTVHTRSGRQYSGLLRWDDDEEYTWEMLNGNPEEGVELQLEFGQLRQIERLSDSAARVELRDGRRFELEGSNDVDSGNKGIFVRLTGGRMVSVEWQELQRVEFRP